jgi:hypothetical protein
MANGQSTSNGSSSIGGMLSGLGGSLAKGLEYALPLALGAAMGGGPLGALAGVATVRGGEAEYQLQEQAKQMELARFALEQQRTEAEIGLKEATQQQAEQWRQTTEEDRQANRKQQYNEALMRLQESHDEHQAMDLSRQIQEGISRDEADTKRMIAQESDQTRRDALAQQLQNFTTTRIQAAKFDAEKRGEFSLAHRDGFWTRKLQEWFGAGTDVSKLSPEEYQQAVEDASFASSLEATPYDRETLLNNGVPPSIVDKIRPAVGARPSDKLAARKPPAGSKTEPAMPKALWGKKGVVGPDGRKWDIDSMGRPRLVS